MPRLALIWAVAFVVCLGGVLVIQALQTEVRVLGAALIAAVVATGVTLGDGLVRRRNPRAS